MGKIAALALPVFLWPHAAPAHEGAREGVAFGIAARAGDGFNGKRGGLEQMLCLGDAAVLDVDVRGDPEMFLEERRHVTAVEVHVIGKVLDGERLLDVQADEFRHVRNIGVAVSLREQRALRL